MKKEEREEKIQEVKTQIRQEGYRVIQEGRNKSASVQNSFPELGLCNKCRNLNGIITEFGLKTAKCSHNMVKLTGGRKIHQCSEFWDIHYVPLENLLSMALFVDPNKNTLGF